LAHHPAAAGGMGVQMVVALAADAAAGAGGVEFKLLQGQLAPTLATCSVGWTYCFAIHSTFLLPHFT